MDKILELRLLKADDNQRGKELIDALVRIGMPSPDIEDKLTFYDVIALYQKTLKEYIDCAEAYQILQKTATEQLMTIVTLGNVARGFGEEKNSIIEQKQVRPQSMKEPEVIKDTIQEIPSKILYLGKCADGQHKEVYKMLVQRGVYIPLKWVENQGDGDRALQAYRENRLSLDECVLYRQIDQVLGQYAERQERERDANGGIEKLTFFDFPILNEALANEVISYFIFAFKNMETYYKETEMSYQMNQFLDAANMMRGNWK